MSVRPASLSSVLPGCDVDINHAWWAASYKNVEDWRCGGNLEMRRNVLRLLRLQGSSAIYNYLMRLQSTHNITRLCLNGVDCEPSTLARAVVSMRGLQALDMSGSLVGWQQRLDSEKIFEILDEILLNCQQLRVLKLAWNGFSDDDMLPIASQFTKCKITWHSELYCVT